MPASTRRIRLPLTGLSIAVHDWGGRGSPALLVHATGFHGHVWQPIAERLVVAGRRVISIDQRGHGQSDVPPTLAGWEEFAADVRGVIGELAIGGDGLAGIGHSSGAVALTLAEADAAGTFDRLWLYEPVIIPADPPAGAGIHNPLADGARRRRNSFDSVDQAIANFGSKPPLNVLRPDVLRAYVEHGLRRGEDGRLHLACPPEFEARVYERMPEHYGFRRLREVACPTVVATGNPSQPGSLAGSGPALVERLPDGELLPFAELGHFGPLQDPDLIADAIIEFLSAA